ncbi:hypothetical protein D777_00499 [Marinobacter nitratireducens]|uniref:Toxin VasX N-terminal region domain-containing protein n=1 Tax=Marinobacter nitratireducens TaxID=1137280 RepID=A0A072N6N7_9GAMM|nr:toxin VasX [Marinobacter nitratireducens]KEF32937.1 hypothetical protein D777_00499 [Marinobacter nitratireducens]
MSEVEFQEEARDQSVFRHADYDEASPADLVLDIPKREGGTMTLPLLQLARSNEEREDVQENTLMRVKPVAELCNNAPVRSGGVVTYTGRGVALLRPGYVYVFQGNKLWRELEVRPDGQMSDIDLASSRPSEPDNAPSEKRKSEGEWSADLLIPAFLQGQGVMHSYRIAFSETQWSWRYIFALEDDTLRLNRRSAGIAPAYAAIQPGDSKSLLTFDRGFPAQTIDSVPPLRPRDLGVELMLEQPLDFTPSFEQPEADELCQRLANRLTSLTEEGEEAPNLDISCAAGDDALEGLRDKQGVVCIAVADPLFQVRHSLAQIHQALQYLDALEMSLKGQPLVHSASLIRQAVFDPRPDGSNPLASYRDAVDRDKLNDTLETSEREYAANIINSHVGKLKALMEYGELNTVLADYLEQDGIGVCEAYGVCADLLNSLQKIPDILAGHGIEEENNVLASLNRWIGDSHWLDVWSPIEPTNEAENSPYARLQRLATDQVDIGDDHLDQLHLQSLAMLEKQTQQAKADSQSAEQDVKHVGQVGKLMTDVLGEWSAALLAVVRKLIEDGDVEAVHVPRIMQGVASVSAISDPNLQGIEVMRRGAVDLSRQTIVGVYGEGIKYGLTDLDRANLLQRGKDYLYANLLNRSGDVTGSTSTRQAAEAIEEGIKKVSMDTWVFTVPSGHAEAQKLSLFKVDFAKRVGSIVDGPAVSKSLATLAIFNLGLEIKGLNDAVKTNQDYGLPLSKITGASVDLLAASMKLRIVTAELSGASLTSTSRFYQFSNRLLFDMKGVPVIGPRLLKVGAPTLVRTVGAISFAGGVLAIGISAWDMRLSLSKGDTDAAMGHAIAMVGGSIFLAAPLMAGLLAIPGWGWAVLGISMAVGGSLFADNAKDDDFERLLKNGPLGAHPIDYDPMPSDVDYYGQLLSMLNPVQATAQRYADIEPDPALTHGNPDYAPQPDDYVITLTTPLISQLRHIGECRPGEPARTFSIVVQEVAYSESQVDGPPGIGTIRQETQSHVTNLTRITARQSLPEQNAIRFLVKRELQNSSYASYSHKLSTQTTARIALQAAIASEADTIVYPTPMLESFAPYDPIAHGHAPPKERSFWDPHSNATVPYWFVTEVEA